MNEKIEKLCDELGLIAWTDPLKSDTEKIEKAVQLIRLQAAVIEALRAVDSHCGVPPITLRTQAEKAESALSTFIAEKI